MIASSRNNAIDDFKGNAVIIGCGRIHSGACKILHGDSKEFFTIDINNNNINPDLQLDITTPTLPDSLRGRFQITIMEGLPFFCYNQDGDSTNFGFKNILDITKENGFIVISACAPKREFRDCLKDLKYIEVTSRIVFFSKNQSLSIDDIKLQFKNDLFLNNTLKNCIRSDRKKIFQDYKTLESDYLENFNYCTKRFDIYPSIFPETIEDYSSTTMKDCKVVTPLPIKVEINLSRQNALKEKIELAMKEYTIKGNKKNETYQNLQMWLVRSQIGSTEKTIIKEINAYIQQRKSHWVYTFFRPFHHSEQILNDLIIDLNNMPFSFQQTL